MKRTPKPKRHEYHITYDFVSDSWVCKVGGAIVELGWDDKTRCIASISGLLSILNEHYGQHSELIIHRKDGTIGRGPSSRRSYGGDPKRSRG